jgi:hypothetical protein
MDDDARIFQLFGDNGVGEATKKWGAELSRYLDERTVLEHLRQRSMPQPPWPPQDRVMIGYLVDRAQEILDEEGVLPALVWLAVHGWYEGNLEERFQAVQRALGKETNEDRS